MREYKRAGSVPPALRGPSEDQASLKDQPSREGQVQEARTSEAKTSENESLDWLSEYGDQLYAYALQRVRSPEIAEDLVQETLLGAIRNAHSYCGDASRRTWLIAILRNKLVDHYRRNNQHQSLAGSGTGCSVESQPDEREHLVANKTWADPKAPVEDEEFRCEVLACLNGLPESIRQTFEFRVLDSMDINEVCEIQNISRNNLAARMYRARAYLRDRLNRRWF